MALSRSLHLERVDILYPWKIKLKNVETPPLLRRFELDEREKEREEGLRYIRRCSEEAGPVIDRRRRIVGSESGIGHWEGGGPPPSAFGASPRFEFPRRVHSWKTGFD